MRLTYEFMKLIININEYYLIILILIIIIIIKRPEIHEVLEQLLSLP